MHGIAIAILKYGYLDDNTALRHYSASCGPDHDSRMSKKKKSGLGSETRYLPYAYSTSTAIFRIILPLNIIPEHTLHSRVKDSITHNSTVI